MVFCLVWGMGGAFISLLMSRWIAKRAHGRAARQRPDRTAGARLAVSTRSRASRSRRSCRCPRSAIYESPEVNAFATGPSKRKSLVAVSSGLLRTMRQEEVEGVLAHEVAHIQNGDMVTMTLIQGVVNAFVMFLARIIAGRSSGRRADER